jgi:hypothetical protein
VTAGWPGRPNDSATTSGVPASHEGAIPLGSLDPTMIHRARSINADALRVIDALLDQIAESGRP